MSGYGVAGYVVGLAVSHYVLPKVRAWAVARELERQGRA